MWQQGSGNVRVDDVPGTYGREVDQQHCEIQSLKTLAEG